MGNVCCVTRAAADVYPPSSEQWHDGKPYKAAGSLQAQQPATQQRLTAPGVADAAPNGTTHASSTPAVNARSPPANWQKGEVLGEGAFGKVYSCLDVDTCQQLAVKQLVLNANAPAEQHLQAVQAEIAQLSTLQHENIVQYRGSSVTSDQQCLNIFLEYVPGGSIASLLAKFGPFGEAVIKTYLRQMLQGLEYLHSRGVLHRNVKAANLLVDRKGTVKLADFGVSKSMEALATLGCCGVAVQSYKGTACWMAPEVVKQTGHGRPADIWSVGCTVIEMATGKPPWSDVAHSPVSVMFQVASSKQPPPLPDHLSPEARQFLLACFQWAPEARPTASALLQHPFLDSRHALGATTTPGATVHGSSGGQAHSPRSAQSGGERVQPGTPPLRGLPPPPTAFDACSSHGWGGSSGTVCYSPLHACRRDSGTAPLSTTRPPADVTPSKQLLSSQRMSLAFNPIQEPSWTPSPVNDKLAAALRAHGNKQSQPSGLHSFALDVSTSTDCASSLVDPCTLPGDEAAAAAAPRGGQAPEVLHKPQLDTGSTSTSASLQLPSPNGWSLRARGAVSEGRRQR